MPALNPLSRNLRDWLYAFALVGMLLRVTMPLWAIPQMSGGGFMLMCTSQGMQWQLGDKDDGLAGQQLPCTQCGLQSVALQSLPFTPPAPPPALATQPARHLAPPANAPPFLLAPPNRAPPSFS
ncbi:MULTISPECIES: DUF2946 family protein [unclassified Pseudomonas]|uniref:DUF2946 family protein n=1 Tax=unclassified Pseudomonas TaxID=196821 RepID=UPI00230508B9|nr:MULTISPECIES: DUF2946 family protein [unclassified Pseudomonas]MDU9414378.1 hypothetical protein [Pseudomonas sp. zfem005]WCD77935.1 hypothetical protein PI990_18160 [Pseudomonas sp. TUM22785]